jgi:hypothetical protein
MENTMNQLKVSKSQHTALLSLFPEAWQPKLLLYTGEELYYAYRLCMFKPVRDKVTGDHRSGDITLSMLRMKLLNYLKGISYDEYGREAKPIAPSAWLKLGRRWQHDFSEDYIFTQPVAEQDEIVKLATALNNRRLA